MASSNPRWPEQVRLVRRPETFFGVGIATRTPAPGYEREYELKTTLYVPLTALQQQGKQVITEVEEALTSDEAIEGFRNGTGPMRRLTAENIRSGVSALLDAVVATLKGGTDAS